MPESLSKSQLLTHEASFPDNSLGLNERNETNEMKLNENIITNAVYKNTLTWTCQSGEITMRARLDRIINLFYGVGF